MAADPNRTRADVVLVSRGFFDSRTRARAAIEAGLVSVRGVAVKRPSELVDDDAPIVADEPFPWVSRGGVKLAAGLDAFGIDPTGRRCLDVGASTGGFTDVLLRRGAASVHAVDVGRGQLHARLRGDPRVTSLEATDIRDLGALGLEKFDLVTVDVSFISLRLVLPTLVPTMRKPSQLVALIKPQFEVGPSGIGRGGLVRDDGLRARAVADCLACASAAGLTIRGQLESPITGGDGNRETLFGADHV